jgi:signal transduction histidine kinase/FixJ family two-component response regulator
VYVGGVILTGAYGLVAFFPRNYPPPVLFVVLVALAGLTSSWKVNVPISVANGATLSVSYAANLMALLLLGTSHAVLISLAGVWTQCRYRQKQSYPLYKTLFSCAAIVITMIATGRAYVWLGGPIGEFTGPGMARSFVVAIATYFFVNTALIAGAISLSTGRPVVQTWHKEFMWLAGSFLAAGTAGALAAVVVARGEHWKALLLAAPIYLTYRTYELFVGRLEDQKRHMAEMRELHEKTVTALEQAREAERALASEKQRLTSALEEMTRLEQAHKAARAAAEQASRLRDQFLATVSHELRTPLTAIVAWADMLHRGILPEPRRPHAVEAIYTSATRQAELIDDLLDLSRIMSGKLQLNRKAVDLAHVVQDAVEVIQPAADEGGVRISVEVDPSVPTISGDAARLQQVAWNLLANAVKFTPPGGSVHLRLRPGPGGRVELTVADTGEGISNEFLPSVFDAFRQADGSTTRVHLGLGIGLSVVKALVQAHGGTVHATSGGKGQGATFTVLLPVGSSEAGVDRATEPDQPRPRLFNDVPSIEGITVLVVDDDRPTREVLAEYLGSCGATVVTAASAAQALDVLQARHIDVLLADIGMPDEDGYSLIRKVRALHGKKGSVPAAALTAFVRDEDRTRALEAGFHLHVAKPIEPPELVAAIARLHRLSSRHEVRGTAPSRVTTRDAAADRPAR